MAAGNELGPSGGCGLQSIIGTVLLENLLKLVGDVTALRYDTYMCSEMMLRVRERLAELIGVVNSGNVSTADARRILVESRAFAAQVAVLQADTAALVAARERNGNNAAGVLAQAAGMSRRDAAGQPRR